MSVYGLSSKTFANHSSRRPSLKGVLCLLSSLLDAGCEHSAAPFHGELQLEDLETEGPELDFQLCLPLVK
jgi:hypothetical protein